MRGSAGNGASASGATHNCGGERGTETRRLYLKSAVRREGAKDLRPLSWRSGLSAFDICAIDGMQQSGAVLHESGSQVCSDWKKLVGYGTISQSQSYRFKSNRQFVARGSVRYRMAWIRMSREKSCFTVVPQPPRSSTTFVPSRMSLGESGGMRAGKRRLGRLPLVIKLAMPLSRS